MTTYPQPLDGWGFLFPPILTFDFRLPVLLAKSEQAQSQLRIEGSKSGGLMTTHFQNRGYVHVYTGNGKGKTTAAFGLALRAASAGFSVYICQFLKGMANGECETLNFLPDNITLKQCGHSSFVDPVCPKQSDSERAVSALLEAHSVMTSGLYDMIILDEINVAMLFQLIDVQNVLNMIAEKPAHMELVLTGLGAPPEIIEVADLVTDMREVKHYYHDGVTARKGIEH